MARRKSKLIIDDGDDDSDVSNEENDDQAVAREDDFDPNDQDEAAARQLFHNPYGHKRKRTRADLREEATYGIFAQTSDQGQHRSNRGNKSGSIAAPSKTDWTKAPNFVSAGASSSKAPTGPVDNLAGDLQIEAAKEDEEDIAMELDSGDGSGQGSNASGSDHELRDGDDSDQDFDVEQDDLVPVPGLAPSPPPEVVQEQDVAPSTPLAFAPRGIGSRARGGGGVGSTGAGIGARAGIGGAGQGPKSSTSAAPIFASATSASIMPLGGGVRTADTPPDGLASGAQSPMTSASTPRTGLGAGIGASRPLGGIGARSSLADSLRERLAAQQANVGEAAPNTSRSSPSNSGPASPAPEPMSTSTADQTTAPRERRSFLPTATTQPGSASFVPKKISKKEQQHFAKLESSGSLGLKMLQKMGWKSGSGLGANEQGIVTPIGEGQKVRDRGKGLSSGERSAGAILEAARMRGEDPDEIEENEKKAKKAARLEQQQKARPAGDAWKQPKRKEAKAKAEYKSYEQIVAESGGEPEGVGMLVDLSGNALPSQSLSSLPAFGTADTTRLPELRHNLTLLTSTLSASLSSLAREGKGIEERRAYLVNEESRVRRIVEEQETAVSRLKEIMAVVDQVKRTEQNINSLLLAGNAVSLTPGDLLEPFVDSFDELLGRYPDEYISMGLDEVVVGAVAPICRRMFGHEWNPLKTPQLAVAELKKFRKHFLIDKDVVQQSDGMEVDMYGSASAANGGTSKRASDRSMTAYETMMWTIWLPRVRSDINNHWDATDPTDAINLFTAWKSLLPLFLRDNILDQLILPKVMKAIQEWSPAAARRGGASLHAIVFPWLEHVGARSGIVLDEAKRKVRAWLKAWKATEGVPADLEIWKDAFPTSDWDSLILKHVLPQLGATLRERFSINPRQQDLKPLEDVVNWRRLIRSSMMSQLLESGFFPKWLDALYIWLTSSPVLEQVEAWFSWWRSWFAERNVVDLPGVAKGFRVGADLRNQALALGDDAKYRLKKPDFRPSETKSSSSSSSGRTSKGKGKLPPKASAGTTTPAELDDVSFRSVVEEIAAESNLMLLATGKAHEKGYALFRVSQTVDGKSGVTVYLNDDVVWLLDKGEYKPVSVEEMVKRALAK